MLKLLAVAIFAAGLSCFSAEARTFGEMFPQQFGALSTDDQALVGKLNFQSGKVKIGGGLAEIDVPDSYYFLDAKDARFVLTQLWGNPENDSSLGMLLPVNTSPLDDGGWAIEMSFDPIGYVSDEDAETYDYDQLLSEIREGQVAENEWRTKNGFDPITIVGWAAAPRYDKAGRKLYWAKELKFGNSPDNTLNYNIRALGRKGVLVLNFIADINALPQVEAVVPEILQIVNFTEGNRYSDFIPGTDTVAAIGIGGLIAGKLAAKAGLLVVLVAFLKKGFVLVLLPLIWLKNKLFGRKTPEA